VGENVFLKVHPTKGIFRFGKKRKLGPKFIRPFDILERVVAYRLAFPPNLSSIDLVFHVSMLKKYLLNSSHVLEVLSIKLRDDMSYKVHPVEIVD
jgi:hypothetical protein